MEYLIELLKQSPEIKNEIFDEDLEKYGSFVDEIIENNTKRIKCTGETFSIKGTNFKIYKSSLSNISLNGAEIIIYIPHRKNSYTLYFTYNTGKFKGNHTEKDEGTGLRIDNLRINLEKTEVYNKKRKKWELMGGLRDDFKFELLGIKKTMYSQVFNNFVFNKNLIINDEKDI